MEDNDTEALDAAIDAAREVFITAPLDLRGRSLIAAMVRAAAPLIPVTPEQRADIERDALLRAARNILDEAREPRPEAEGPLAAEVNAWEDGFTEGMEHCAHKIANNVERADRARAASVGTEEERDA